MLLILCLQEKRHRAHTVRTAAKSNTLLFLIGRIGCTGGQRRNFGIYTHPCPGTKTFWHLCAASIQKAVAFLEEITFYILAVSQVFLRQIFVKLFTENRNLNIFHQNKSLPFHCA